MIFHESSGILVNKTKNKNKESNDKYLGKSDYHSSEHLLKISGILLSAFNCEKNGKQK